MASKSGRDGSILINQDASLYLGKLMAGETVAQVLGAKRYGWLQLIKGELNVNGTKLQPGDAAKIEDTEKVILTAAGECGVFAV